MSVVIHRTEGSKSQAKDSTQERKSTESWGFRKFVPELQVGSGGGVWA